MRNRFRAVFTHPPPGAVFPAPWGRIHSAWFLGDRTGFIGRMNSTLIWIDLSITLTKTFHFLFLFNGFRSGHGARFNDGGSL